MPRPPRELARTSRRPRALGWAQPERKYNQSHRAEISERRISLILVCRGDMMDHRGYIMSHRGYRHPSDPPNSDPQVTHK